MDVIQPSGRRQRRPHTRSKNGCSTCKKRRVRCGEERPICHNCKIGGRDCCYSGPVVPLRDRRLQESTSLKPWQAMEAVMQFVTAPSGKPDPFDTFPIEMPFQSQRLFHYLVQSSEKDRLKYRGMQPQHAFQLSMKEPFAFRGAFLLGGVHYASQVGSLGEFERTMYFHLMEAMRTLNWFLSTEKIDPRSRVLCMNLIAALATVETFLGNYSAAQTHVNGLVVLLTEVLDLEQEVKAGKQDESEHLLNRMLIYKWCFTAHEFLTRAQALSSAGVKQEDIEPWEVDSETDRKGAHHLAKRHELIASARTQDMRRLFVNVVEKYSGSIDSGTVEMMMVDPVQREPDGTLTTYVPPFACDQQKPKTRRAVKRKSSEESGSVHKKPETKEELTD